MEANERKTLQPLWALQLPYSAAQKNLLPFGAAEQKKKERVPASLKFYKKSLGLVPVK